MKQTHDVPLTIALPKGRLLDQVLAHFASRGFNLSFENRKLIAFDEAKTVKAMLVKNSDLPTYVRHGISGLGICGSDVLYEAEGSFYRLLEFSFGRTNMCLAGTKRDRNVPFGRGLTIATKFPRFTRAYFNSRGIPVEVIKLNGSVELAPVLGLAPYIVDLVETGGTLKAHNLEVIDKLEEITVYLIANPAYYKLHYERIDTLVAALREA